MLEEAFKPSRGLRADEMAPDRLQDHPSTEYSGYLCNGIPTGFGLRPEHPDRRLAYCRWMAYTPERFWNTITISDKTNFCLNGHLNTWYIFFGCILLEGILQDTSRTIVRMLDSR